jgi:hypothetical protein
MWRRLLLLVVLTVTTGLLSYYGIPYVRTAVHAAAPVKTTPFTAKQTALQVDNEGRQTSIELRTTAVSSTGAQVDTLDYLDGRPIGNFTLLDLDRRVRISVDPVTESITTYPQSARMVEIAKAALRSCSNDSAAEHRSLLGQAVFKRVNDSHAGRIGSHSETWIAPALSCFPLEATITFFRDGSRFGQRTMQTTSLVIGNPDAALFVVPNGYTERPPSAVFAEFAHRNGQPCTSCENSSKTLDKAYYSHQQ